MSEELESSKREEEEYIEEEDEDFNPDEKDEDFSSEDEEDDERPKKKSKVASKDRNDDDFDLQTEKEVKDANYSKIESSEGGLVKTRTQRALEQQQERQFKITSNSKSTIDIEDAWLKLKQESENRLKYRNSSSPPTSSSQSSRPLIANEKIKIKRKYEYAGEIVTEEKWVDRESAEAYAYINSLKGNEKIESSSDQPVTKTEDKPKQNVNDKGEKLRTVRKRPPLLEGIINGSIKPKFNTLEKSKVDFAKFVDKEGINDELIQHNKDGYLERQDFLSRVQFHKDTQIKEIRKKELQNHNK